MKRHEPQFVTPNKNDNLEPLFLKIPWGLDRIDQQSLPLDNEKFKQSQYTGIGVNVYILDSGIQTTHEEFYGRVHCGRDFTSASSSSTKISEETNNSINHSTSGNVDGNSTQECTGSGHGTHVAGIVGGTTYGVAKDVHIFSLRVLDDYGEGSMSDVIAAVNYVIQEKLSNPAIPVIINMSLGGEPSEALNTLIRACATEHNVHVIASAGNDFKRACQQSPAMAKECITVGATNSVDRMAFYSNWGRCVDILA